MKKDHRPVIGITMGDPVGVGPEIILSALDSPEIYRICRPLILGDAGILARAKKITNNRTFIQSQSSVEAATYEHGNVDVLNLSELAVEEITWGQPNHQTGGAMVAYIMKAIDMALKGDIEAMVTCPINKSAMHAVGFSYNGHTEILAEQTHTTHYAMMLAGDKLRVVLVTIHVSLREVPGFLSTDGIYDKITITEKALKDRFGIRSPRMAVAGLNPHAGEKGILGDEEDRIIAPAVDKARQQGFNVSGPFPPDTLFNQAVKGVYDAVICMYHDQGLIPFKLIHFGDGVNTTLGLPIIRTSVDHGTAYDIAGTGQANPGSLTAAIKMAVFQAKQVAKGKPLLHSSL